MFPFPNQRRPVGDPQCAADASPNGEPDIHGARGSGGGHADGDGAHTLFCARQPVFDRGSNVFGYEMLFRSGPENRFTATDIELATATSIEQNLSVFGLDSLVGDRLAFVNLSRGALLHEFYRLLPRERTVIELLENIKPDRQVMEACLRMKAEGYRLALDDFTNAPESLPFLAVVDMVKVDFRAAPNCCDPRLIERLRNRRIHLLAEKVETHEEHKSAVGAGYDLFQGYYYRVPQMIETRDLPPSKLAQLRFLAEVGREDASFERLEQLFLQDVGLTLRLLRYLNSAAFGWRHEITSLRHALALMGLRPLRKWAMMMGMMAMSDDRPRELAVTALSRGRFAERLGPPTGLHESGFELFLTGMLSLADAMIGRPLDDILKGLTLPDGVRDALAGNGNGLRRVLDMVTAYERGDWSSVETVRSQCHIEERLVGDAYRDSLAWAEATSAV